MSTTARLAAARTVCRVGAYAAADRVRPSISAVPHDLEALSPEWLTAALCGGAGGGRVVAVHADGATRGTTSRCRLTLTYDDAGQAAGLPRTVFAKAALHPQQRITQAITGPVEPLFYLRLRPLLDVEAPRCVHGEVDDRRMSSIMLLEDLIATKGATFLDPTTPVTRDMAEQIVTLLAATHDGLAPHAAGAAYLKTYPGHWHDAFALVNVRRYFLRAFDEASDLLAPEIQRHPERAWRAVLASIALHDGAEQTVIHNDVHLGNWYQAADGRMGLCDWQAVVRGHWSRDLAYALATTLSVDDRRAWDRELVALYAERRSITTEEAWTGYRRQLWGALAYWAPTFSPPRLMPSDMQPRSTSGELLRRISTACADHDAFGAVGV